MKKRAAQSIQQGSSFWPDSVGTRRVVQPSSAHNVYLDPERRFSIVGGVGARIESLLKLNPYAAAVAFVNGEISVEGDVVSAIRFFLQQKHSALAVRCCALLAGAEAALPWRWSSKENISFHYDRSDEFYELFLDSRMIYSAAHFETPETPLENAQIFKLDRICADLRLRPGEQFLDIGCGWGGLIIRASQQYGAISRGCTLSDQQFLYADSLVRKQGLEGCVTVENCQYRDVKGTFDKVASVGMFEHVRKNHLFEYFRKVYDLLDKGGLFLNRGIVRPEGVKDDPETLFLHRNVFPGGHLVHLADVMRAGERSGFEALAVENFRQHYARTCLAWVNRLQTNCERAIQLVGAKIYRTWLLYLAASAVNFEDQVTSAAQVVFAKARSGSHARKRFLSF